jgi:hypothetical protein
MAKGVVCRNNRDEVCLARSGDQIARIVLVEIQHQFFQPMALTNL